MKKLFSKKIFSITLIAVLALAFIASSTGVAFAESTATPPPSSFSCSLLSGDFVTCGVYYITYFLSQEVLGMFVSVASWFIQLGLQFRLNVFNSPAVQSGFGATLALANLGFVILLIIVAIATILHRESYNYKKSLWRLVVMAILVNFGLVLTAPIVSFANGMTNYFIASINGGSTSVISFVNKLNQDVSPSAANQPNNCDNLGNAAQTGLLSPQQIQQLCPPQSTSPSTTISQALLALVFSIIFQIVIIIAFFSIAMLVFLSYFWLTILLILLPFAWVAWIFPKYQGQFGKWWGHFIKWTFSTPIAMFFIWVALTIENASAYFTTVGQAGGGVANNTAAAGIARTIGSSVSFNQLITDVVVLGVMVGGLMAASEVTKHAGGVVVDMGKYVGRRAQQAGKRAVTFPLRTKPVKNIATKLQTPISNKKLKLANYATLGVGGWTARKIGQGLESGAVAGGTRTVEEAAGRFKDLTAGQRLNRLSGVEKENAAPQRMALLKQILEDKTIGDLSRNEMNQYFGKDQENAFKRFGQDKLYKELREKSGLALVETNERINELEDKSIKSSLTEEETNELNKKRSEKQKIVTAFMKENTKGAVETFISPEKLKEKRDAAAKTGRVPMSLEDGYVNMMQKEIVSTIPKKGVSTATVSILMKGLAENDNVTGFEKIIDNMKSSTDQKMMDTVKQMKDDYAANEPLQKWNERNIGRDLGTNLHEAYDYHPSNASKGESQNPVPQADQKQSPIIQASETGGNNRRTRSTFNPATGKFEDAN
jgi:hypothetical protein